MEKDNIPVELRVLELKKLINQKFIELGDLIGDLLILTEINELTLVKNLSHLEMIKGRVDNYSEHADEILNRYKFGLINDIEKLLLRLASDLQTIR